MRDLPAMLLLCAMAVLAACSTSPAADSRPYTVAERLQLDMEALNREGLDYDHYQQAREQLLRQAVDQDIAQLPHAPSSAVAERG